MAFLKSAWILVVCTIGIAIIGRTPSANGANFLTALLHPLAMTSHNLFVARVTSGLIARGHTVTIIAADTYSLKGINMETDATNFVTYKTKPHQSSLESFTTRMASLQDQDAGVLDSIQLLNDVQGFAFDTCTDMFDDQEVMTSLRKQKFDLLLLEMFTPCDALLAAYFKRPFIVMMPSMRHPAFDEDYYHMAIPSSYFPFMDTGALTDEMTFLQRLQNFLERYVITKIFQYIADRPYRAIQLKYDIEPGVSIREISGRAELWLAQIDFALQFPHPTAPNWISIAGLTATAKTKSLPKDLEDFVQGSGEHGVIVFSMGSTQRNMLNEEKNEAFAKVFSELPQRVIWKYHANPPRNLGNNTRLMTWIPQSDLLAHRQIKLLIYHGGQGGVYEAMHFKKPMVIVPMFADQPGIGARVQKKKMGVVLSRTKISVESIKSAIEEVLHNPIYKTSVEKFGSISLDTPATPMETTMFWIEHIVKFGGSHLRTRAGELNFITLNSLDVIAFLLALGFVGLYLDFIIIRSCYRCFFVRKKKTKSD